MGPPPNGGSHPPEMPPVMPHVMPNYIECNKTAKSECVINCAFTDAGLMDPSGAITISSFISQLEKCPGVDSKLNKMKESLETCSTSIQKSSNACTTATNLASCMKENAPKHP